MARVHTHYDNLKVVRNAPPELIHAAYRTLSQKYHPDRNPGNSEAARIMAIINASYEVLSDPIRLQEHDTWIAAKEKRALNTDESVVFSSTQFTDPKPATRVTPDRFPQKLVRALRARTSNWLPGDWIVLTVILIFIIGIWFNYSPQPERVTKSPPANKPYVPDPPAAAAAPLYVRPAMAPNGSPWPRSGSYIRGYKNLRTDGRSTVTVDNSKNESDVFVKLVFLDSAQAYPVRVFFIPAYGSFTVKGVRAGNYDVRYKDLGTGGTFRTEPFLWKKRREIMAFRLARSR